MSPPSNDAVSAARDKKTVLVVGAGVVGMMSAIRLKEHGHDVSILAQETPSTILDRDSSLLSSTTPGSYCSVGAGGLWMPFAAGGEHIEKWGRQTFEIYQSQADLNIGVAMKDTFLLKASKTTALPWYAEMSNMEIVTNSDDPRVPKQYACALRFCTPIVHMDQYIKFLEKRLQELGISVELTASHCLAGESSTWDYARVCAYAAKQYENQTNVIIVNCCGLGARFLTGEETIPGRGATVRVKKPSELDYVITEDKDDGILSRDGLLAYAIPRGSDQYTLGGTLLVGDWREHTSDEEVQLLKDRCNQLIPGIGDCVEIERWVGLRPYSKDGSIKVELRDERQEGELCITRIDNYGHGGSGVTLGWGCAEEVVGIVEALN